MLCFFFSGNKVDACQVQLLFRELGFEIYERHNLTVAEMRNFFKEQASENYDTDYAFGACIIVPRGDTENTFRGTDDTMEIKELFDMISAIPSLRPKPKLLILHFAAGKLLLKFQYHQVDNFR